MRWSWFKATACGVAGAIGVKATLVVAGFAAKGIMAGTFAAAWHASIGSVAKGSLFAFLQALGAGSPLGWILLGIAIGVAIYFVYEWYRSRGGKPDPEAGVGMVKA